MPFKCVSSIFLHFLTVCLSIQQRRRIQNRNAQRNFRQRQEKERRMLVEKLMAAEQQCNQLSKNCDELNSVVNTMRERLKRLEAENSILRSSVYSIPWQKDST
jgi:predicted nuclease with TOPRIM domain